jgi:predicted P-loop ATPase/GTPase
VKLLVLLQIDNNENVYIVQVHKTMSDIFCYLFPNSLQGVYEPENTKIVTLTMNPFSMARKRRREEIADIVEDNKRLKTRIELIEENQGDLDDITQQVSVKLQQSGVDSKQIQGIHQSISKLNDP